MKGVRCGLFLKNSICRSEFDGEKFLSLAQSLMERVVSCYDEKKTNIIKADVITSMARKMSSILCLTKTQNDQMLHFWKTMMVFVFPESEAVTKRVHASFNSCVRQSLRDDQNQIETVKGTTKSVHSFRSLEIPRLFETSISCRVSRGFRLTTTSNKFLSFSKCAPTSQAMASHSLFSTNFWKTTSSLQSWSPFVQTGQQR